MPGVAQEKGLQFPQGETTRLPAAPQPSTSIDPEEKCSALMPAENTMHRRPAPAQRIPHTRPAMPPPMTMQS